jgi:ABC-type transport system involved in Fe-S cluster assembly fused permease/ATPase subunit
MESMSALLCGVIMGFVFQWREALVCLGCVPLMIIATAISVKFQKGLSESSDKASKEANVLAGDAIINYRTVASFGNEDQLIADYERMLDGPVSVAIKKCHAIGIMFGLTQFVKMAVFAVLYYAAAQFIQHGYVPLTEVDKVFMAIFCMMFGAQAAGQASSFGPDVGKAKIAAQKIFTIIDTPSQIATVPQPAN